MPKSIFYEKLPYFLLILGITVSFLLIWNPKQIYDEPYHLNVTHNVYNILYGDKTFSQYSAAQGPLTYIIWAVVGKTVSWNLPFMRLFVFISGIATLFLFYKICKLLQLKEPIYLILLLFFMPKFFLLNSLLMSEMMNFFFILFSLLLYLKSKDSYAYLVLSSLLLTSAVFMRQTIISIPAAYIIYELFLAKDIKNKIPRIAILSLPLLGFGMLVLYWGGVMAPLETEFHTISFNLFNLPLFLVTLGFWLFVLLFTSLNKSSKWDLLAFLFLPVFFLYPLFNYAPGIYSTAIKMAELLNNLLGGQFIGMSIIFILFILGAILLIRMIRDVINNPKPEWLPILIAAFTIGIISFSSIISDRYFLQAMPFLLIAFCRINEGNKRRYLAWILYLFIFSLVYVSYRVYMGF